jgi:hypothetical protein
MLVLALTSCLLLQEAPEFCTDSCPGGYECDSWWGCTTTCDVILGGCRDGYQCVKTDDGSECLRECYDSDCPRGFTCAWDKTCRDRSHGE